MKRAKFLLGWLIFTLAPALVAWTFIVTNFFGIALDPTTFTAPGNNQSPVYDSTAKKWKVAAAVANDGRLPTPAITGAVLIDAGAGGPYGETAQGAANTLLHGTGNSTPTFSKLVDADITVGAITAGSLATATVNRLMLTPATIGRIEVDGGAGNPPVALAQGAAGTLLISQGAAANPAFNALSGDATITSGGVLTLGSTISAAGPIGDGTHVAQITFDAKGRLTTVTSVAITASGSTIGVQSGGSDVTGSPASKLNFNNGLIAGTVSGGISAVQPDYGTAANKTAQGNDSRFPSAPSGAGKLVVDISGTSYGETAAGATNTLLHGQGAATPTYSALVDADITAGTITAGSLATAVTNRLMLTPSTVGAIEVDGGTGAVPVRLAQGAAGTILISQGAAANPAFTAMSTDATIASNGALTISALAITTGKIAANAVTSGKVDSTVIIASGANAFTGDQSMGSHALTNLTRSSMVGQSGNPSGFAVGDRSYDTTFKAHIIKQDIGVGQVPLQFYSQVADSTAIANTTAETTFDQLPGSFGVNTLTAGTVISWDAQYLYSSTGSPTFKIRYQFVGTGTSTIADNGGGFNVTTGATNGLITVRGWLQVQTAGASGTYRCGITLTDDSGDPSHSFTFGGPLNRNGSPSANIDTTQVNTLKDLWTWSAASASNTIKRVGLRVQVN